MPGVTEEKDLYLSSFTQFEKTQPQREPLWVHDVRKAAIARFLKLGFPSTHNEDWRFTNVAPIAKVPFRLAGFQPNGVTGKTLERFTGGNWAGHLLVFLNGHFSQELSSPRSLSQGAQLGNLATALQNDPTRLEAHLSRYASYHDHPFVALNTAFISDGAFVYIPKDSIVDAPIHLLFIATASGKPEVSHPRNLIVAGANTQVKIVESYVGLDKAVYFTNAVTEIVAGENSVIDHYKLQRESVQAFHVATLQIQQARSTTFSTCSISMGGALVRNDVNAVLDGEGCESVLNGLYLVTGQQHVDNHTQIDHAKPHCSSREFYKGILDEKARGVFNGRIIVRPGAQKTDSKQTNKNLLLSEGALVNTNPQLEIYADDVKCTHGATIGQLSADVIFYLRSRGINLETARNLLTYAFASDITSRIKIESIRTELENILFSRLPQNERLTL
ncbi:MAG: Fe-S cluster assembly protein SufD [Acidobacteria bacterium]|nr:MAG: Fe-S cluster assembly protein SufD [Acidobacteriota bacterium]